MFFVQTSSQIFSWLGFALKALAQLVKTFSGIYGESLHATSSLSNSITMLPHITTSKEGTSLTKKRHSNSPKFWFCFGFLSISRRFSGKRATRINLPLKRLVDTGLTNYEFTKNNSRPSFLRPTKKRFL